MSKKSAGCGCGCEPKDETEWCEKVPPPLRIFATVGMTSHCCVARGKQETEFNADAGQVAGAGAAGFQIGIGGLGIAAGKVSADAQGGQDVMYRVMYMADNVIQTTTFKICWWTCGGYPGKSVSLAIRERFPSSNDVVASEVLAEYPCLPPESACDECCCLTYAIKTCHTVDDPTNPTDLNNPNRVHRQLEFVFTAVDGCGKPATCTVSAKEP